MQIFISLTIFTKSASVAATFIESSVGTRYLSTAAAVAVSQFDNYQCYQG